MLHDTASSSKGPVEEQFNKYSSRLLKLLFVDCILRFIFVLREVDHSDSLCIDASDGPRGAYI